MPGLTDILIASIILVSAALGLGRGLVRELLSVLIWIVAILVAVHYGDWMGEYLREDIPDEPTRHMAAIGLVFVPTLVLLSLISALVARVFLRHHRDSHDQLFGMVFGAVRGVVIIAIAVVLGRSASLDHEQWWAESVFIPKVDEFIHFVEPHLPGDLAKFVRDADRPTTTRKLTLYPNPNGQYLVDGEVNGKPVEFLLDTGASLVMLPEALANELGLSRGEPLEVMTAVGSTAYRVELDTIRVGNIEVREVRGAINPNATEKQVLLGTSFLRHINYQHERNSMVLEQTRYIN